MARKKDLTLGIGLIVIEATLLFLFFSFIPSGVFAVIGNPNATVPTLLEVGNVFPEVLNVSINEGSPITLNPNSTKLVWCTAVLRDYNADTDINVSNSTFHATVSSSVGAANDNNYHYSNSSCVINTSFGSYNGYNDDAYSALANCTYVVQYYAVAEPWECNVWVNDSYGWTGTWFGREDINQLLAVGLPANINYGLVNATYVSDENITNITNVGNVALNLSLEGYAVNQNDGLAMNCSQGNIQNISVEYEMYNLTNSTSGDISYSVALGNYTNLTTIPSVRSFNLTARQDDGADDTLKPSYWRIYVPVGVAGNCTGNVIFGATTANGA